MSLRIVHSGDAHIDSDHHGVINPATGKSKAWESNAAALASGVETAIAEGADVFIHAGDAFKNGRPSQEAVLLFAETLKPLLAENIALVLLGGNHENILVPSAQRTASTTVARLLAPLGEVHVVEREPEVVRLACGLQVMAMPWLSKTAILARSEADRLDPQAGDQMVVDYALSSIEAMSGEVDASAPVIFTAHATVDDVRIDSVAKGQRRGSEVDIAHLFAEPILPRAAIEASPAAYGALAHIHARQRVGPTCYYAGSPNRLTFTDADEDKSVNLVTITDDNTLDAVSQVPTAARAMHSIDLTDRAAEERLAALTPEALVRLVLAQGESEVPPSVREAIAAAGATLAGVKTLPAERTRSTVTSLPEKVNPVTALDSWLSGDTQDRDFIVAKAASLVQEIGA